MFWKILVTVTIFPMETITQGSYLFFLGSYLCLLTFSFALGCNTHPDGSYTDLS